MTGPRQLHLGAFMRPVGIHTAWWRYPGAWPDANFNLKHLIRFAQTLERGRFDAWFMADHLAVLNLPMAALKRSATVTSFDPLTLLSALAMVTEHLGLIATASTTFEPPYLIARRFASLDHISGGRAGWNLVTTSNPDAALNFGLTEHMEHGERYRRAREFFDVVTGLWDSWAEDAFIRDVEDGLYFDPERMHVLDHKGEFLSVRGPLNIARPIQGWPVIVQAAAADAREKRALLDSLVHPDSGIASLSIALGHDASGFDLDGPLPEIPESNASKSGRDRVIERARRDNLTVRQLAQIAGSYGGLALVGTPKMIADQMEEWLLSDACDGFNIMFPYVPGGLDDFVDRVVPELQRRGLFRREYEGKTLRENLGLPRPENRFFASAPEAARAITGD